MNIFMMRVTFYVPVVSLKWQETGAKPGWSQYQTYWWWAPIIFLKYWNLALRNVDRKRVLLKEKRWMN